MKKYILPAFTIFLLAASTVSAQTDTKPKIVSGGVVNGKAVELAKPVYPAAAMAVRAGGEVKVQVTIDEQGNVISATAVSGHALLRASAEQAARISKFKPTFLSGQAVKVTGTIIYNFVTAKTLADSSVGQDMVWVFGMFFSILQKADETFIRQIGDEKELDSILADMAKDIPDEFTAEKPLLEKLVTARGEERRALAGEILFSIKTQVNSEERWQIEIGEHLGAVMVELLKHIKKSPNDEVPVDAEVLRTNLQKMKQSLLSPPTEMSSKLIAKFKAVSDFADAPDLNSPDTLDLLHKVIEPLFTKFTDGN